MTDQANSNVQRAVQLVEQSIAALGIDPTQSRVASTDGSQAFALRRGSAAIFVAVHGPAQGATEGTLRVVAPVVRAPAADREAALFRRLLEANATELVGVAFGLRDGEVVLVSERSVRDLDASEVDALIRSVGRVADRFDDLLAKEFGAQRSSDPKKG
jgi:hypothetical protein